MRTSRSAALAAVAGALLAAPGLAAAQHAVVGADEVRALQKKKAVVVDARTPEEYRQVHIAGAINLPPERIAAEKARLPKDRAAPIVFYCRGPG